MGNLLKVLTRDIENYPHFFLDFESKSGRGDEQKGWMEKEMCGGAVVGGAQLFPFCQQVSAPDDEAVKESASAPLCFSFAFFPSCSPVFVPITY